MIALLVALTANGQVFDAEDAGLGVGDGGEHQPEAVVNGEPAKAGDWDDAVGIVMYGSYVGCTGTLIHPRLVLTAAHCAGAITDVVVGSTDWTRNGEVIGVERTAVYPSWERSYDAAVLILDEKAKGYEPRLIAQECILDDYLYDGAEVAVVGFGGTRIDGGGYNSRLNEGYTFVQDSDGDRDRIDGIYTGFNPAVSPGGEIGAGGNEVDSCFGDSGGPLYLLTDEGDYLVGLTSRSYAGVPWNEPCLYGGIYVRPDALIEWIEDETGKNLDAPLCNLAPSASAETIYVQPGGQGSTVVTVDDPDGKNDKAVLSIGVDPAVGTVEVLAGGELRYTAPADYVGDDSFVVVVTDKGAASRYPRGGQPISIEVEVPVVVSSAPDPGDLGTELAALESTGGCGCDAATPGTLGWLSLTPLLLLLRRRD